MKRKSISRREDAYLSKVADERFSENVRYIPDSDEVWGLDDLEEQS